MAETVYEFNDYKAYLDQALGETRGLRSRLAESLGCQSAFVSKVINGDAHFSLEHAVQISEFLEHTPEEEHQFLLLVQLGRAGSKKLEQYYKKQVEAVRNERRAIKSRLASHEARPLTAEEQATYYSSWLYAAIHVLVSIREFNSREALARHLNLKLNELARYLDFLLATGILEEKAGRFHVGSRRMHLGKGSAFLAKHHANWRIRSLDALERQEPQDVRYSGVISLSRADVDKIQDVLLKAIERVDEIMKPSPEEVAYSIVIDFFRI